MSAFDACNGACAVQATRAALTSEEGVQAARLSKKLVTIQTDVQLPPLTFPFSQLSLQSPSDTTRAAVKAAFAALEFRQHEKRLDSIWENMTHNHTAADSGQSTQWGAANAPAESIGNSNQPVPSLAQPANETQ